MVDFTKVDKMIEEIEGNIVPEGMTFNDFAKAFYLESKAIPLSKYLRNLGKTKKLPKVMNMKRAGQLILLTEKDKETVTFLKRNGFKDIPSLNYTVIMLLRKSDLKSNWTKVANYFNGKGTIEEINNSTKVVLLPNEREKIKNYITSSLELNEREFESFLEKYEKTLSDSKLTRALKKIIRSR